MFQLEYWTTYKNLAELEDILKKKKNVESFLIEIISVLTLRYKHTLELDSVALSNSENYVITKSCKTSLIKDTVTSKRDTQESLTYAYQFRNRQKYIFLVAAVLYYNGACYVLIHTILCT